MINSPDPAFRPGDIVDFTGSVSKVVTRTTIKKEYEHVFISPKTIGVIIFIELHEAVKTYWYGVLVDGKILWLSALLQGVVIRKVQIE